MVRSSSSKSTKEKKLPAAKSTQSTKSKAPESKTSKASGTKATKVPENKPRNTTQKNVAKSAKTAIVVAKETKARSKTLKSGKSRTPAAAETPDISLKKVTSSKAAPSKMPTKSGKASVEKAKSSLKHAPRTPELFEGYTDESAAPSVSIFPSLLDTPRLDREDADIALKMPKEFQLEPVLPFSEPSAVAQPTIAAVEEKEVTFSYLGFGDEILAAIRKQNFQKPTRVQALCLPHTLDGKDVAGFAQTGTGKTAVYLLTAAHKLLAQENRSVKPGNPHVLVIVPTRELADQVCQDAKKLLSSLKLRSLAFFGGVDVEKHVNELSQPVDIIVSTPGRLLDLHRHKHVEFNDLQMLVIDECDRMFDMGFVDDVEYVLRHLPAERVQKLLFSATGSEKVKELAFEYLEEPEYVETDPVSITPEKIAQVAFAVTAEQKFLTLMGHLRANNPECAIVFTNTKVVAEWVGYKLACNGLNAEVLTGDLPQRKRMTLIKKIKEGKCNLLVATDVLSRGLHVANLSHVYNFDIPDDAESFIHRIGRTARAGAAGHAITLICEDYGYNMGAVEKLLGFKIPLNNVPASYLAAEDISDYPFDENGRVKVYGQQAQAANKETETSASYEHPRERHHKPTQAAARSIEAPISKSTRPEQIQPLQQKHRADTPVDHGRPTPAPQRGGSGPTPVQGHTVAAAAVSQPSALGQPVAKVASVESGDQPISAISSPMPQPRPQRPEQTRPSHRPQAMGQAPSHAVRHATTPRGAAQPTPHRAPVAAAASGVTSNSASASGLPRRDDKARETIELAIQAAKKAAAKRKGSVASSTETTRTVGKNRRGRVTTQIDEIAAAVLTSAQEHLSGTIGNLQDRFMSRFEENFPKLSETLTRLGFFSKRFTDDR